MENYTKNDLDLYLKNDWINGLMDQVETEADKKIRTNQWLREIEAKRLIYADIYGDLLTEGKKKILDVGGGY